MRYVITWIVAIGCVTSPVAARLQPGVSACALLTREMVAPFTANKAMLDLVPPSDESLGGSGSACDWGGVRLQLFATPRANQTRTPPVKDMQPVAGVGEAAYFRSNRDRFAELVAWTATHRLMLQVSVPMGKTAEAIKPETSALANAIIAKLR